MSIRDHEPTQQPLPEFIGLDALPLNQAFDVINAEDRCITRAVAVAKEPIVAAARLIAQTLRQAGRLIYVGSGTGGRLGTAEAAEYPAAFLIERNAVHAIDAPDTCDDCTTDALAALDKLTIGAKDVVFGINVGGPTPFAQEALRRARERGARTVALVCAPEERPTSDADVSICVLTGPEVISDVTHLKVAIAAKMTLNTISTLTMLELGKVHRNVMVDIDAHRAPDLRDRAVAATAAVTGLPHDQAQALLDQAGGSVKTAVVMHHQRCTRDESQHKIAQHRGELSAVLGISEKPPCA